MSGMAVVANAFHNKDKPVRVIFVNRFFYPDELAPSLMLTDFAFAPQAQPFALHVVTSGWQYADAGSPAARQEKVNGTSIHQLPAHKSGALRGSKGWPMVSKTRE
jgi:colanic acid biosynthesis glycosyl transferase WcaI